MFKFPSENILCLILVFILRWKCQHVFNLILVFTCSQVEMDHRLIIKNNPNYLLMLIATVWQTLLHPFSVMHSIIMKLFRCVDS